VTSQSVEAVTTSPAGPGEGRPQRPIVNGPLHGALAGSPHGWPCGFNRRDRGMKAHRAHRLAGWRVTPGGDCAQNRPGSGPGSFWCHH